MIAKNGHHVPNALGRALSSNKKAAAVFGDMRPSCQQRYMDRLQNVSSEQSKIKTPKIINAILEYGTRHPVHE